MNKNQIENIVKAKEIIDLLCEEMEQDAPLHNVQIFLHIAAATMAKGENLEVKEIVKEVKLMASPVSRALGALGEMSYKNRPGLGLIEVKPDYEDRRRKPMGLTRKGEKLCKMVAEV